MFRLVMVIVLCFALFTGFAYFYMSKQADRFMDRIQHEALELFDRRAGLDSVKDAVQRIAREQKVEIHPNDIKVQIVATTDSPAAAVVGMAAAMDSVGEAIEVAVNFTVRQFIYSHTFSRKTSKQLKGTATGGRSHGGYSGGFDVSRPTRDVHSHRQSVERAVSGQSP